MPQRYVLWIACLLLGTFSSALAQELKQVSIPSPYYIKVGNHINYIPKSSLELRGYDFSKKRSWSQDYFITFQFPFLDFTYTYSPEGISETTGAVLFSKSHRGDAEFKLGWIVNPTVNFEWSAMDLHTWKLIEIEKTLTDKEEPEVKKTIPSVIHNRDLIRRIYGGAGLSFETSIADTLTLKAAGSYRFINQRGWEGSAGLCWFPNDLIKGRPNILVGITTHEAHYDWGVSRNWGLMTEFSLTF